MAAGGAKRKILLIDDDYDFLESMHLLLVMDGHDVIPISDGRGAVDIYREFEPDIVLLDVRMPGIDGFETFLRLKRHDGGAKIVFTSSYAINAERYKEARSKSLSGMLTKPIEPAALRKAIRTLAK
ncbi:MAG: response regulator [Thaumarchaeota archaeon]|nr:response regulator [Nitrososphaerota archaeon]MDE0265953.1 response regulator [Nitrososphaerota archaeon]MDE0526316.1 response regulator [Nitrososphaerota archaeon]